MSATYERTRHLQAIRLERSYCLQYEYILAKLENVHSQKKVFLWENFVWSDACADLKSIEACTTAAKFVETLQRSNEQLVKIAALVHKKDVTSKNISLDEKDKNQLFDIIKGEEE